MKKGETYKYGEIYNFVEENDFDLTEIGASVVGRNFLIVSHKTKDMVMSFVLSGATDKFYLYDCVYSDLG